METKTFKSAFIVTLVLLLLASSMIYFSINSTLKTQKWFFEEKSRADSLQYICTNANESLQEFNTYKVLYTSVMVRDNATKQLKYQVGDVIYCKPDSIKSVITDVIIGGSKYNYYIKYKIITKKDSILEIIPEQIY